MRRPEDAGGVLGPGSGQGAGRISAGPARRRLEPWPRPGAGTTPLAPQSSGSPGPGVRPGPNLGSPEPAPCGSGRLTRSHGRRSLQPRPLRGEVGQEMGGRGRGRGSPAPRRESAPLRTPPRPLLRQLQGASGAALAPADFGAHRGRLCRAPRTGLHASGAGPGKQAPPPVARGLGGLRRAGSPGRPRSGQVQVPGEPLGRSARPSDPRIPGEAPGL